MIKRILPFLIAAIALNACGPVAITTSTSAPSAVPTTPPATDTSTPLANILIAPTAGSPQPTYVWPTWIADYGVPTFSTTFTPLPVLSYTQNIHLVTLHMMDVFGTGWAIERGNWDTPNGGHILHTNDGAETWQDVTPPQGSYQDAGFFALDGQTAWATPFGQNCHEASGVRWKCDPQTQTYVWSTQDGGQTWTSSEAICLAVCFDYGFPNSEWIMPRSLRFIDNEHGWLLIEINAYMSQDRYKIFSTRDGGATWNFASSSWADQVMTGGARTIEPLDLNHIFFTTSELFGARDATNHLSYYESHSGAEIWDWPDWVDIPIPSNPIHDPMWDDLRCGIEQADSTPPSTLDFTQECYVHLDGPHIWMHYHSGDAGKTWTYWQQTGDVEFIDELTGWQLKARDDSTFDFERTHDGGQTWETISIVDWNGELSFVSDQIGWALARRENTVAIVKTVDGGKTWHTQIKVELTSTPIPTP